MDSRTNMILGICQERGHKFTLEFRSITQADFMVDCLNAGRAHFGVEMIGLHLTRMNVHIRKPGRHNVVCPDKISDLYVLFCLTLWLSEISYVVYVEYL